MLNNSKPIKVLATQNPTNNPTTLIMKGLDGNNYRLFAALPTEREGPKPGWRITYAIKDTAGQIKEVIVD